MCNLVQVVVGRNVKTLGIADAPTVPSRETRRSLQTGLDGAQVIDLLKGEPLDLALTKARRTSEPARKRSIAQSAERLFSRRDYDAVSIRDIATAAGVNSALVGYYFGTKDQLYRSLFQRRYDRITEHRIAELDALEIVPGALESVRAIVRIWTRPLLELASSPAGKDFAGLLARQSSSTDDELGIWRDHLQPSAQRCLAALNLALPGVDPAQCVQGYVWMIASVMSCMSPTARETGLSAAIHAKPKRPIEKAPILESFIASGLMAIPGK